MCFIQQVHLSRYGTGVFTCAYDVTFEQSNVHRKVTKGKEVLVMC